MNNMNSTPFVPTPFVPTPFVPTPFSPEECVPAMYSEPSGMQPARASIAMIGLEDMYPEIYSMLFPLIARSVEKMSDELYTPTPESISAIVDNIIKNSGLWYEDDDFSDMNSDMIPVQQGFGRMPFQRHRRGHHNRNTLRDIVRILLLRELLDNNRGYGGRY